MESQNCIFRLWNHILGFWDFVTFRYIDQNSLTPCNFRYISLHRASRGHSPLSETSGLIKKLPAIAENDAIEYKYSKWHCNESTNVLPCNIHIPTISNTLFIYISFTVPGTVALHLVYLHSIAPFSAMAGSFLMSQDVSESGECRREERCNEM